MLDFELARIYHPDSAVSRPLPAEVRQERWNAISAAYDSLRGKGKSAWPAGSRSPSAYPTAASYSSPRPAPRRTPWGGFEHDGHPRPHPDGLTEPFYLSQNTVMLSVLIGVVSSLV